MDGVIEWFDRTYRQQTHFIAKRNDKARKTNQGVARFELELQSSSPVG